MIIYGWTTLQKTLSSHEFHCPQCGSVEYGDLKSANRWFTLYFIPVIPLGSQGQYVECVSCAGTFHSEVLDYDPRRIAGERAAGGWTRRSLEDRDPFMAPYNAAELSPTGIKLPPRKISWAAVGSVLLGVLSVLFIFGGTFGLILSVATIVAGHSGMSVNKRAPLRFYGRRIAIAGLILGYGTLVVGTLISALDIEPPAAKQNVRRSDEQNALDTAELLVGGTKGGQIGSAFGNDDEARRWAGEFTADVHAFDKKLFAADDSRTDITGQYKTWCELHADRCAFVVNVPGYGKISADDRRAIKANAWAAAQRLAKQKLKPGDQIAVGLRNANIYGAVLTGGIGDPVRDDALAMDPRELLPFFRPDAAAKPR